MQEKSLSPLIFTFPSYTIIRYYQRNNSITLFITPLHLPITVRASHHHQQCLPSLTSFPLPISPLFPVIAFTLALVLPLLKRMMDKPSRTPLFSLYQSCLLSLQLSALFSILPVACYFQSFLYFHLIDIYLLVLLPLFCQYLVVFSPVFSF